MKRTISDYNKGFSKVSAEIRKNRLDIDVKRNQDKLSADFKKIVNQDCYGVQRKEIR